MNFAGVGAGAAKAWKDSWGAAQGVGAVKQVMPAVQLVQRLADEYAAARADRPALSATCAPLERPCPRRPKVPTSVLSSTRLRRTVKSVPAGITSSRR